MPLNLSSSYSPAYPIHNVKGTAIMTPTYTFTQKTTAVTYPWPSMVTGMERIVLSAQGDLQRILSAFFARPISVVVIYSHTYWQPALDAPPQLLKFPNQSAINTASPETPIIQRRQVRLQCSGKTICTATSTVRITSPSSAHLFLVEKYAIGQMFRRLEKMPIFDLLSVGLGPYPSDGTGLARSKVTLTSRPTESGELWRRYRLSIPSFDSDIVEVFPDRQMFVGGGSWLDGRMTVGSHTINTPYPSEPSWDDLIQAPWFTDLGNTKIFLALGCFLMIAYAWALLVGGGRCTC